MLQSFHLVFVHRFLLYQRFSWPREKFLRLRKRLRPAKRRAPFPAENKGVDVYGGFIKRKRVMLGMSLSSRVLAWLA